MFASRADEKEDHRGGSLRGKGRESILFRGGDFNNWDNYNPAKEKNKNCCEWRAFLLFCQNYHRQSSSSGRERLTQKSACVHAWPFLTVCYLMDCSRQDSCVHGFSRQEYRRGLPLPPPEDLSDPGVEPKSPALAGRFFTTVPPRKLN